MNARIHARCKTQIGEANSEKHNIQRTQKVADSAELDNECRDENVEESGRTADDEGPGKDGGKGVRELPLKERICN